MVPLCENINYEDEKGKTECINPRPQRRYGFGKVYREKKGRGRLGEEEDKRQQGGDWRASKEGEEFLLILLLLKL